MFYVYGVTMNDCKKRARKKLIDSGEPMTQSEFDRKLIDIASEIFKSAKPKCISGDLSCPKRVRQFLDLASKDCDVRALQAMKKVHKLDSAGNPILTKRTGRPTFSIVPMNID